MFEFRDYMGNEYIRGFLQGAVRKGLDPHAILRTAGIPAEAYDDPEAQIGGKQLFALIMAAKEATNDIYLGFLEFPAKLPMELEVVKHGLQSETLGEALKAMSQFIENYRHDFRYAYILDYKAHEFCLQLNYKILEGVGSHIIHLYRLSNAYRFCSWLIGKRIKLTRVCFPEPRPGYCYDYRNLFHCDIEFNQPDCQLCFDEKYLPSKIVRTERELATYLDDYNDWFMVPGQEYSLSSQIERILLKLQKDNCAFPPIEVIAEILSMNPRTIRRVLARENESYQKIKSRLRCDLAVRLLLNTDIPVASIAEKVGFAEPGDFTRAFVKWTNSTPSGYRAAHDRDRDTAVSGQRAGVA